MSTQLAGMDLRKLTRPLELFAKEVMPGFLEVMGMQNEQYKRTMEKNNDVGEGAQKKY